MKTQPYFTTNNSTSAFSIDISEAKTSISIRSVEEDEEDDGEGGEGVPTDPEIPMPDEQDDNPPSSKPWPNPALSKKEDAEKKIFALLVGINAYPMVGAELNGCLKDVDQVEKFLRTYYGGGEESRTFNMTAKTGDKPIQIEMDGNLVLCMLKDDQATYDNIIQGFRQHLSQATQDDTIWFHFSGHGSEQFTAKEFYESKLEPNGKDQTLVCYKSDTLGSQLHLADKELAVLLHEVETPKGNDTQPPHIVVSLDCCHSGSGTRNFMEKPQLKSRAFKEEHATRNWEEAARAEAGVRDINTYVDGYYARQNMLQVPVSKHVLFSGCESIQKAGDLPSGGVFTTGLIDALTSSKGNLNYSDLFIRTRVSVKKISDTQTPQFETIGNFDPYTRFLDGSTLGTPDRFEVFHEGGKWFVKCGAIHGIPMDAKDPIELEIQTAAPENRPVALAELSSIGAQRSPFELKAGDPLSANVQYQAVIRFLPAAPVFVKLSGEPMGIVELIENWDSSKNVQIIPQNDESTIPEVEIKTTETDFIITDLKQKRRVLEVARDHETAITLVMDSLGKMVKWERTIRLDNEKSSIRDKVEFELDLLSFKNKAMERTTMKGNEIKIYASPDNFREVGKALAAGFAPKVIIRNADQPLFCYLLHLRSNYSIEAYEGEITYRPKEYNDISRVEMALFKQPKGWGLSEGEDEAVSYFKLLVTTESLDYQQLLQSGIGGHRDLVFDWNPVSISDEWLSITMKVTLVRQENEIGTTQSVELADGNITIQPHAGIKAKVGLSSAQGGDRSNDPTNKFALFDNDDLQLIDFSSTRTATSQNVLEITDLEISDSVDLEKDPLQIRLKTSLNENEMMLPIAFDGENFRIIGDSISEGNDTLIQVRELPEVRTSNEEGDQVENPFGEDDPQHRSLFRALKMAFFKIVFKKKAQNMLRWVEYKDDGTVEHHEEGIKEKVAEAKNIIVLLHGYVGNTTVIAEGIQNAMDGQGKSLKDKCDLVLTYDYENLHTPIQKTGEMLKDALNSVGLNENDDKNLTVLGSSMGGLVVRWFVERDGGKNMVDHVILVGTPNLGSNLGKIDKARKMTLLMLDISLNFVGAMVPFLGYLSKGLHASDQISITLAQLAPGSDFIERLNRSEDPGVPYSIIGGDATKFASDKKGFKKLMDKAQLKIGDIFYGDDPHDIIVGHSSIYAPDLWKGRKYAPHMEKLVCHHLIYYGNEQSLKALGQLDLAATVKA